MLGSRTRPWPKQSRRSARSSKYVRVFYQRVPALVHASMSHRAQAKYAQQGAELSAALTKQAHDDKDQPCLSAVALPVRGARLRGQTASVHFKDDVLTVRRNASLLAASCEASSGLPRAGWHSCRYDFHVSCTYVFCRSLLALASRVRVGIPVQRFCKHPCSTRALTQ